MVITEHPALEQMRAELAEIEAHVGKYSLADAIREGSQYTDQAIRGFVNGTKVCALSTAFLAVEARGI